VPVLLIALLAALIYFGDVFVVDHGGELDARVHQPFRSVKELEDLQPKSADDVLKAKGQKIYNMYCNACHMGDGNGNPSAFIPPLAGSDWVNAKDPSRIIRIVLNGLQGPIVVNGKPWGQAVMLPWRDALNDEDVAAVLTFVRSSWGNKAPALKAEDVKKIRDETKDKGGNWTADDLLKIPLKQ
jgi:mono/diheme cytochrome c family protein